MTEKNSPSDIIEIKLLYNSVKSRISNIEARGGKLPQYASMRFRDLKTAYNIKTTSDINKLSESQLIDIKRDLRYIDNLKTSTVAGAISAQKHFEPISDALDTLSPELKDEFWRRYGRAVENAFIREHFKYTIMEKILNRIEERENENESTFDKIKRLTEEFKEEQKTPSIDYARREIQRKFEEDRDLRHDLAREARERMIKIAAENPDYSEEKVNAITIRQFDDYIKKR